MENNLNIFKMWPLYYWLLAIIGVIGGLYYYGTRGFNYFKDRNFPFAGELYPFLGNMGPFVFKKRSLPDQVKYLYDKCNDFDLVGVFEFGYPVIMLNDPEQIRLVTVKDFEYFADRMVAISEENEPLLGKNLLSLEGHRWKDMRTTLSPTFTSSKMKAMFQYVAECGIQLCNYLEDKCQGETNGIIELDLKDLYTRYANDVIATSALGVQVDSLRQPENEFYRTGKDLTNFGGIRALIFFGYRICNGLMKFLGISILPKSAKKYFSSLVIDTMKERESKGIIRPDMIHLLMQARKGVLNTDTAAEDTSEQLQGHKMSSKMELSDTDIVSQALLFFFGGFDTTSTNLCFLSTMLATHPDVQRRLQNEIDRVLDEDGGKLTYDNIGRMKYLDMCVAESLRLWPPGFIINRKCVKPYVFPATKNTPSIRVNKGDGIWIPVYGIHRDPKYFDRPHHFEPERFSDENKHEIQPFTYLPFGAGPRNCIGMRFAQMETKIAVASLLSRFDLRMSAKTKTPLRLTKNFNMSVEGGFWLGLKIRTKE